MAKLTLKQQQFVNEYMIDLNATQAYKRAGYSAKSEAVAGVEGHKLLKNPKISDAIEEAMKKREKRTEITADRVLEQLAKVAFSDMKDFMEWKTVQQITDYKTVWNDETREREENVPVVSMFTRVNIKDSAEVDGTLVQEISETNKGGSITHTMKLNDRMKALELLGKHLGLFTEKLDIKGAMMVNIVDDVADIEDDEEDED